MEAKALPLDQLPVEIIRKIAVHGDGPSLLALAATNRTLRLACYDAVVLQALVEYGGPRKHDKPCVWPCSIPRPISTLGEWARWALADFEADRARDDFAGRQASVDSMFAQSKVKQAEKKAKDAVGEYPEHAAEDLWPAVRRVYEELPMSMLRWLPHLFAMQRKWHVVPSHFDFHMNRHHWVY